MRDKKLLAIFARQGFKEEALLGAGYSLSDLLSAGYSASDLLGAGYSASDLLGAGYSLSDLRSAGYSLSALLSAGYSASALLSAGYSASALLSAGYSASDLLGAGYSLSDLLSAGYSLSALLSAGYSASALEDYENDLKKINVVEKPYSKLWEDIESKRRIHNQSDWGPKESPEEKNICNTAMCTAGHLVNLGNAYWAVKKYGWPVAASMVHERSTSAHLPQQNYGSIPQDWALAFIEENAKRENL